jgi:hypothetical protein
MATEGAWERHCIGQSKMHLNLTLENLEKERGSGSLNATEWTRALALSTERPVLATALDTQLAFAAVRQLCLRWRHNCEFQERKSPKAFLLHVTSAGGTTLTSQPAAQVRLAFFIYFFFPCPK